MTNGGDGIHEIGRASTVRWRATAQVGMPTRGSPNGMAIRVLERRLSVLRE